RVSEKELVYPGHDGRYHYDGRPFTGIAYTLYPSGELKWETEYRDGVPWGYHRKFRRDGSLEIEETLAPYKEGYKRTWHANGQLASEEWCHFGLELTRKRWDAAGHLIGDYVRPESDDYYQRMLEMRKVWRIDGQPIPRPPANSTAAEGLVPKPTEPGASADGPSTYR
ncbi:MAG TPA: hypothetical protein VFA26_02285, partial [Gemmataceae bacterium]|nr:hypothetical protein [Gemmataceae bacterium]